MDKTGLVNSVNSQDFDIFSKYNVKIQSYLCYVSSASDGQNLQISS